VIFAKSACRLSFYNFIKVFVAEKVRKRGKKTRHRTMAATGHTSTGLPKALTPPFHPSIHCIQVNQGINSRFPSLFLHNDLPEFRLFLENSLKPMA
jgi:hypothetical protein